jgi:hypothetical protein
MCPWPATPPEGHGKDTLMITNDEQLNQAVERLGSMYRALAALRAEVLPVNASQFALMAEGPIDEIRRLQVQIDAYTGREAAEEHDADVWLRLYSRDIGWPEVPISVLTAALAGFRKGVQMVARLISSGQVTTRPRLELRRACDMRVIAFRPGSLRVGLRLPDESDGGFAASREKSLGHQALVTYLNVAAWVSAEGDSPDPEQQIGHAQKRRLLLNALKPLVPRSRGDVEGVEISSRLIPDGRTIRLTRAVYHRLVQALERPAAEEVETYVGRLREIDLDHRTFTLRDVNDVSTIRCTFQDDLLETARGALGRWVRVSGSRPRKGKHAVNATLRVSQLEVIEEMGAGPANGGHSA